MARPSCTCRSANVPRFRINDDLQKAIWTVLGLNQSVSWLQNHFHGRRHGGLSSAILPDLRAHRKRNLSPCGRFSCPEDQALRELQHLVSQLRKNRTVDWQYRNDARAHMRMLVIRLLKKYKYPPEGLDAAMETVLKQCEVWTDNAP